MSTKIFICLARDAIQADIKMKTHVRMLLASHAHRGFLHKIITRTALYVRQENSRSLLHPQRTTVNFVKLVSNSMEPNMPVARVQLGNTSTSLQLRRSTVCFVMQDTSSQQLEQSVIAALLASTSMKILVRV
jgi:hypothetical protein